MAASDVRAGGAFVELYTKDAAFQKGLEAATRRLKAWGASVTAVGASIGAIGASIMAPILAAAQRWADDDLRSVNAQIEFVLRDALNRRGRLKPKKEDGNDDGA